MNIFFLDNVKDKEISIALSTDQNKKHCCFYCNKLVAKLARHLERKHINEIDVTKILSFPKKSKSRLVLIEKLRNQGNFQHNTEILKIGKGNIIPKKRPKKSELIDDYLPCDKCGGFFKKYSLARHQKICVYKKVILNNRNVRSRCSLLLPDINSFASENLKKFILSKMIDDKITLIIKNDPLILKFGNKLFSTKGHESHLHSYISQKMREVGRFLFFVFQENPNIKNLEDCLIPSNFPLIVKAVKKLAKFDENTNKFGIPSLALKSGHNINKCLAILIGENLIKGDTEGKKKLENLSKLMENWKDEISSHALRTL